MGVLFTLIFALFSFSFPAFADSSSSNYSLVEDRFTGGAGNASSTNYQVAETSIETFGRASMTSSNYALETKVGISGGADIATINSVSPSPFARFYHDGNASYTVSATSQDGDALQYSAQQDEYMKVAAQSLSMMSWSLTGTDIGRHDVLLSAIDPQGTTLKKEVDYVFRRPTK
jgi:hypothetical protein